MDTRTTEEELRSFLSLVEPADVGVYISLGGFTSDAEASARRGSRRITLIDGEGRQLLPIKPVHFLDLDAAGP